MCLVHSDECEQKGCQYFFAVNSDAQLENESTLTHLIEANRLVVFLVRMELTVKLANFYRRVLCIVIMLWHGKDPRSDALSRKV